MRTHPVQLWPAMVGCALLLHTAQPAWAADVARPDRRQLLEQQLEHERQAEALLASKFEAEAVDVEWSRATLRDLQKALEVLHEQGITTSGVECRARTCRLQVAGTKRQSVDAALQSLGLDLVDLLPSMRLVRAGTSADSVAVTVYLERPKP